MSLAWSAVVAGVLLVVLAHWARRRGGRWETLVALRFGTVLVTEIVGVFLAMYGVGLVIWPPDAAQPEPRPGPGPGRGVFIGPGGPVTRERLPVLLATASTLLVLAIRVDLRDLLLGGATRDPLTKYIGWESRALSPIVKGGFGEIAMRDGAGDIRAVVATADVDIAEGAPVRVVGVRGLHLVVAPRETPDGPPG